MDVKYYQRQLELADKEEKKWRSRAEKTIEVYDDDREKGPSQFNILWSNVETQRPALYSQLPKPDVRRRYRQKDDVARAVSEVLNRALEYCMDQPSYDFDRFAEKCVLDYVLPGRMVGRVKYKATFTGEGEDRTKTGEKVYAHHVPWKYYRQQPAGCWEDVGWVAYGDNFLTEDEIVEEYGKEFDDVPLKFSDEEEEKEEEDAVKRAQIWELWDKDHGVVVEFVVGYDKELRRRDDPLKLQEFFPGPEPALIIESPNSQLPCPEYTKYQYQAEELNEVTERISLLTESMQAKGFYPGDEADKIDEMLRSKERILIPVDDWAAHMEKGGTRGMIDWMPIEEFIKVWEKLILRRSVIISDIFELTGISDIQRGSSDPRETRGAQLLKANFGNRRFISKQKRIQKFFRDILRLKAEIMAEHFSVENLSALADLPIPEPVFEMLRSDRLRSFAIDIETDSTIAPDDQIEKQGAAEFLTAMSNYLNSVSPIVQAQPNAVEPLGAILLWMTRKFKIARPVEAEVENFIKTFRQLPQQRNTESDGKMAELQARLKLMAQEKQAKAQLEAQERQAKIGRENMEAQAEIQRKNVESQAEIARKDAETKARIQREAEELRMKQREAALKERLLIAQGDLGDRKVETERKRGNVVPIESAKEFSVTKSGDSMSGEMVSGGVKKTFTIRKTDDGFEGEIVPDAMDSN